MELPGFLKPGDNDSILFSQDGELVFYIPEMYFEREFAVINGEYISLLGIFNYSVFDKSGKSISGLKRFNYPTVFVSVPAVIEKVKGLKLTKSTPVMDYRLLKYKKNDTVILSTQLAMIVDNIEDFLKMFNSGALPNTIPVDKLQEVFMDNVSINGNDYEVSASLIGVIVSEAARSINDKSIPWRLSGSSDLHAYSMVNIKDLPNITSPFTALTSENWDESVANAIINKKPKDSPLEKLFIT